MDVSRICSDLVAIRSENPPGRTAEVIEYIRTFLDTLGIGSKITRTKTGQNNLITTGTSRPASLLRACGCRTGTGRRVDTFSLFRNRPGWFCVGEGCYGHEGWVCLTACHLPYAG